MGSRLRLPMLLCYILLSFATSCVDGIACLTVLQGPGGGLHVDEFSSRLARALVGWVGVVLKDR